MPKHIKSLSELSAVLCHVKIPVAAVQDIDKRITDWLASGGSEDDPYILQQCRFIENICIVMGVNVEKVLNE